MTRNVPIDANTAGAALLYERLFDNAEALQDRAWQAGHHRRHRTAPITSTWAQLFWVNMQAHYDA